MPRHLAPLLLALAVGCFSVGPASAAEPPSLNYLFPAGASPGSTRTIKVNGSFPDWPVQWWCDQDGVAIRSLEVKGEIEVTVSEMASHGRCWMRAWTADGASELIPFLIDRSDAMLEAEPNNRPREANPSELDQTVDGKLGKSNDVDCFAVSLDEGQTLFARVSANSWLGSPVDVVMQICDAEGRVVVHRDDTVGPDPQIEFRAKKAGIYLVRLFGFPVTPNSTIGFAGGDSFVYRLSLTSQPFIRQVSPALLGQNLGPVLMQQDGQPDRPLRLSKSCELGVVYAWAKDAPGWYRLGVKPSLRFSASGPVAGRLEAGQAWTLRGPDRDGLVEVLVGFADDAPTWVRVHAESIRQPLDGVMKVVNDASEQVGLFDDTKSSSDPEYLWAAKADKDLRIQIRDRFGRALTNSCFTVSMERKSLRPSLVWKKGAWKVDREEASTVVLTLKADREQEVDWEARLVGLPAGLQADPIAVSQVTKEDQELSFSISISEELGKELVGGPIQLRITDNHTGEIVCRGAWSNSKLSTEFDHAWLIVPPANSSEE